MGQSDDGGDLELIRTIADNLPVGVWVAKVPSGEYAYANLAFREILGIGARSDVGVGEYSQPYGIHTPSGELYPEDRLPFVRALQARTSVVVDDIVIHRPDGAKVNIRAFARPLFDSCGEMTHIVIVFTDITREIVAERARAEGEARLRHALRLDSIGNLAGGIAHDFNNILSVITLLTSQLEHAEHDPERRQSLAQIAQIAESGAQVTRQLLRFARREMPRMEHLSVNEIVRSMAGLLARTIDRRVEICVETRASTGRVVGDPSQIEQIVMNLALNARDAMPDGGRLVMRSLDLHREIETPQLPAGSYVALEVVDTGHGIDAAVRERVFEPYFTTKTSGSVKGTGLGLATAYGIAHAHGGVLEVAESSPRGTRMRVLLPAADVSSVAARGPRPSIRTTRGEGTILVAEDEPLLLSAAARGLGGLGYSVVTAVDGAEALDQYRAHMDRIDAVVLDLVMPKMSGQEVCREIRALKPGARVLLTTGVDRSEGSQPPGCAFLPKPYDIQQLSEALASLLTGGTGA